VRNRILEISESPARLCVEHHQLLVKRWHDDEETEYRVPLADLAAIVIAHPQVTYTQAVLSELTHFGGAFLVCDAKRMPVSMLLPLNGNSIQTERFRKQIALKEPAKKRLWQQIVKGKIVMQADMLERTHGDDGGLRALIPEVKSGDPTNVEARAARKYWGELFGKDFRRDVDAFNENRYLNYGYAVLRAATARAVCAAGLHPSLGVHHHNKYNAWCLADDVMEPFRPVVDQVVFGIVQKSGGIAPMDQKTRAQLIRAILSHVRLQDQIRTVIDALSVTAASLAKAVSENQTNLALPQEFAHAAA